MIFFHIWFFFKYLLIIQDSVSDRHGFKERKPGDWFNKFLQFLYPCSRPYSGLQQCALWHDGKCSLFWNSGLKWYSVYTRISLCCFNSLFRTVATPCSGVQHYLWRPRLICEVEWCLMANKLLIFLYLLTLLFTEILRVLFLWKFLWSIYNNWDFMRAEKPMSSAMIPFTLNILPVLII